MKTFLKLTLSATLLGLVAWNIDWPSVAQSMSRLAWWALPVAAALHIIAFIIGAYRWNILLSHQGLSYKVIQILPPYFIGAFFNNFLPSSTGGDFYRIYHIHSAKHGAAASFSPVITERVLGLLTLMLIASIAFLFYDGQSEIITRLGYAAVSFLAGLGTFLLALGIPAIYWPLHRLLERWRNIKYLAGALQVTEAIHELISRPRIVSRIVLISGFMQFCVILLFWVLGTGVGSDLPFLSYLLNIPMILLAAGLPITIGGLGVREATAITLLVSSGMQQGDAATITILFIPIILLASLPGLFFFLSRKRRSRTYTHGA